MNNLSPPLIQESNLSRAWGRALIHISDHSGTKAAPLLTSLTGFSPEGVPEEDERIRKALDDCLAANGKQSVHTVANTLFPQSLYRLAKYDRHRLYTMFLENYPRYVALDPDKNGRGMYFQRLITNGDPPNQLEFIISQFLSRPGVRASMFQAATFDPKLDHTKAAQLGFPCMQQISFVPVGQTLIVNAFYATQQLFEKAYGNYLGVCRLGSFMAREMKLTLAQVNCFAGVLKLERIGKTDPSLRPVIAAAREAIQEVDGE